MQVAGAHATRRRTTERHLATKRSKITSPKASEIVELVHALSSDLGSEDGVVVGRGIAGLLRDAYRAEGLPVPGWVKQLATHYAPRKRKGVP